MSLLNLIFVVIVCGNKISGGKADGCLTTETDIEVVYVKQLREDVDAAECQLFRNTTFTDYNPPNYDIFDFIVVGGGSAGSVVASRLSENPNWRVLLLEAGGDPTITTLIPYFGSNLYKTALDWDYMTEPQPNVCLGSINESCYLPRGKVLGGTHAINGMLYVRGDPQVFNEWGHLGNPGWNYKDMLYYFKKSEDLRSEVVLEDKNAMTYHGVGGLLTIESFKNNDTIFRTLFSKGFKELGYNTYNDVNAQHHTGLFVHQGTLKNGRRDSTASAFLFGFQSRPNLKISKNSFVVKVLIDGNNHTYGVQFVKSGATITVKATKEVIVSCGVFNSPQLLMLSGVGPRKHLQSLGIPVKQDLAVGYNLQDQPAFAGFPISLNVTVPPDDILKNTFEFLIESTGEYVGIGLYSNSAFIKTNGARSVTNIQISFNGFSTDSPTSFKQSYDGLALKEEIVNSFLSLNSKPYLLGYRPVLVQPRSRGRVSLRSTNPFDHPKITVGYYNVKADIEDMLKACKLGTRLVHTKAMKSYNAKLERVDIPECNKYSFQSDNYWRCLLRYLTVTDSHTVGTCKMGPESDDTSVVNPQLQVIGIKFLRVIDASVMPIVSAGNTNAPTIASAEKGADLIKRFWAGRHKHAQRRRRSCRGIPKWVKSFQ